ncbi:MAG: tautomerase family protein [Clostridia bacterium]
MPYVSIQMFEGRDVDTKRSFCQKIAQVVSEEIGVKPEAVTVRIDEMKKENYYINGELFLDKK